MKIQYKIKVPLHQLKYEKLRPSKKGLSYVHSKRIGCERGPNYNKMIRYLNLNSIIKKNNILDILLHKETRGIGSKTRFSNTK